MKSIINRHTAAWKKFAGISLAIMFGLVGFLPNTAEARLIFTTEDAGVEANNYTIDVGGTVSSGENTDLSLTFGQSLGASITYNDAAQKFTFSNDVDLGGHSLKNFLVENATSASVSCSTNEKGRMYYDTTSNDLLFCNGTAWVSTSTSASGLDGDGLTANGSGQLNVNVDGTTLEVSADTVQVKDGGISTAKLDADAVTSAKIAAGAVENSDLANNAVNSAKIADGTITSADLGTDSVDSDEIATDAVTTDEIADGTIRTADIDMANFTIGSGQITDNSLTADDLGTNSVGADELADNAVDTAAIQNGAVTTAKISAGGNDTFLTTDGSGNVVWELKSNFMSSALADGKMWVGDSSGTAAAVTMSGDVTMTNTGVTTIANDAITTGKIAAGAVENSDLANNAVNSAKIADNSITSADLGVDSVGSSELADDAVDTAAIQDDAVTSAKIDDGTIATVDIANGAITGGNGGVIADNTITKEDLAANSVEASELADNAVDTAAIQDDAVTAAKINADVAGTGLQQNTTTGALEVDVASIADGVTIGDDGNGKLEVKDREVSAHVAPEFPNFTIKADGSNNRGTLESDHDDTNGNNKNYYSWKTRKTDLQDYDIIFQWMVPDDFQGWSTTNNPIEVDYKTNTTDPTENKLDITMLDTAGATAALTGNSNLVSTTANTWVEAHPLAASNFSSGTFTPGEYVTIKVKMSSKKTGVKNPAYLGAFTFNYVAK